MNKDRPEQHGQPPKVRTWDQRQSRYEELISAIDQRLTKGTKTVHDGVNAVEMPLTVSQEVRRRYQKTILEARLMNGNGKSFDWLRRMGKIPSKASIEEEVLKRRSK